MCVTGTWASSVFCLCVLSLEELFYIRHFQLLALFLIAFFILYSPFSTLSFVLNRLLPFYCDWSPHSFLMYVTLFRAFYLVSFKEINQTRFCMVQLTMARKYAGMKTFIPRCGNYTFYFFFLSFISISLCKIFTSLGKLFILMVVDFVFTLERDFYDYFILFLWHATFRFFSYRMPSIWIFTEVSF